MKGVDEWFFSFTFFDLNENFIFMSKSSMEAWPQLQYELFVQSKKDTYCHIMSQEDQKLKSKFTFVIPKFKLQKVLEQKTSNVSLFWEQQVFGGLTANKNIQVFLHILNWVNNAMIWTPELVCDKSEMDLEKYFF